MIRLKGKSSWRQAIALDPNPKMQFVLAFNKIDPDGRFMGLRKIELDMPRSDHSFLRQRLGLYYERSLGLPAQCANNARLVINGAYYGLYTNLEHMDKEFLQREFPDQADGDLWDAGRTIETNETTFDWAHIDQFWQIQDVGQLAQLTDLDAALEIWAAEALMPDGDGYYGGSHNYFLYDHPTRGFVWLSHDLDAAIDFRAPDIGPIFWRRDREPAPHYLLVANDPAWRDKYVAAMRRARAGYDVADLESQVDAWEAQILDAAASDPMKPFTTAEHVAAVAHLRAAPAQRAAYMDAWLACWQDGGGDLDGDGADACHDCDDGDPAAAPGAPETCDALDDDCDGRIDEPDQVSCPPPPPPP
jgi:hypothetical protein